MLLYFSISSVVFAMLLIPAIRYRLREYEYGTLSSFDYCEICALSAAICIFVGLLWPLYFLAAALSYLARHLHKPPK